MNYKSPVDLLVSEINLRMEGEIFKAVQNVGVNVDKDELIKALQYDRDQYQKGYADRDSEIVRCEDCEYRSFYCTEATDGTTLYECHHPCANNGPRPFDWFCADGRRRDE